MIAVSARPQRLSSFTSSPWDLWRVAPRPGAIRGRGPALVAVLAAMVLAACSGGGSPTQPPPVATQLAFRVQPSQTTGGQAITPAVQVAIEDASGNTIGGATNQVTVAIGTNPAGGSLSGPKSVSAANGIATFSGLSIDKAGAGYTLTASSGTLTGATSATFQVVAAAPAQLAFTAQPSNAGSGVAITPPVAVAIEDAIGNIVTSATNPVTVAIGTNPAAGTLSGTTTVPAVSGIATFSNLSIDRAASGYTLVATSGALTGATSVAFAIQATQVSYTAVSAGDSHACGVTSTGAAYCWGLNPYGELGIGTTTGPQQCGGSLACSLVPAAVLGGLKFTAVSARDYFTCGLTTTGVAECWGLNADGQLGTGTTMQSTTPAAVTGGLSFTAISANEGYPFACGVTSTSAAYCWGNNRLGGLGIGSADLNAHPTPVAVTGGLSFTTVTGGFAFACGVTAAGAASCWGQNGYGQLGSGVTGPQSCNAQACNPAPVAVVGGHSFTVASAGGSHACGVTSTGAAYCWGDNTSGELGIGSVDVNPHATPLAIAGGLAFTSVSAGATHVCGVASSGAAYCWGDNGYGELGDGTMTSSATPVAVAGGLSFAAVSAGNRATCGVTPSHVAYCWGFNAYGQLGNGTTTNSATPVKVTGQP
jgi:alpha-tubulin suppressor-like RCC1 family protein